MGQEKREPGELSDCSTGLTPGEGERAGRKVGWRYLHSSAVLSVFGKATREPLSQSSLLRSLPSLHLQGQVCLVSLMALSHWWVLASEPTRSKISEPSSWGLSQLHPVVRDLRCMFMSTQLGFEGLMFRDLGRLQSPLVFPGPPDH